MAQTDNSQTPPARKSTRKATRKASTPTKAAAKKTATKKTATKRDSTKKPVAAKTSDNQQTSQPTRYDRALVTEKIRVHALAKLIGSTSKELILELDKLGLIKVAQSTLSVEEAHRLLDSLEISKHESAEEAPAPAAAEESEVTRVDQETGAEESDSAEPAEGTSEEDVANDVADDVAADEEAADESGDAEQGTDNSNAEQSEPEERIRRRVEKNVANEIHQIEEKVEKELAEAAAVDFELAAEAEKDADLLEDIVPEVTPAPESTGFEYSIFLPPGAYAPLTDAPETSDEEDEEGAKRKRRGRRGKGRGRGADEQANESADDSAAEQLIDEDEDEDIPAEPVGIRGSTRLEAQRRRRTERREEGRKKRHVVSEAEFLARRESVDRTMVVREKNRTDGPGLVTQVGVLEDDLLVEHFVTSETQSSMVGNIYLGRVQNVLPSMEAAFIDIGKGRNGVLYAGEVDWKSAGLGGRSRRIEQALKSGDQVLVQVSKDPVGHKGARLTTQISLAGRFLVYVPGGRSAGISRKLPEPERRRLKEILKEVVPGTGGAIIRTAAEGVHEREIEADVKRLHTLWEDIQERTKNEMSSKGAKPVTMYEEPDMLVKVVRDLFNEDFSKLVVEGTRSWNTVHAYIQSVAPDLLPRLEKYEPEANGGADVFEHYRIDEQLHKALSRKVWLPSGGTLVIDRTEAMTVIDVNTGKFTGAGGNLEETVTRNNLEAAEEIVRQMRLRDMGGMIVVDFIDMVLPENQTLVLRRLTEALGRDRTRHQVSEVTSLGLVQITRKKLGTGLLETFSTECECCSGRGIILHNDPVEQVEDRPAYGKRAEKRSEQRQKPEQDPAQHPVIVATIKQHDSAENLTEDSAPADVRSEEVQQETEQVKRPTIEELAAAVVIEDTPETKRPRRRRGSRNQRNDQTVSEVKEEETSSFDAIIDAAVSKAKADDPDQPSGEDHLPTYEEALKQYNDSPRRRRATRGNSKSDFPPKPEDFKQQVESAPVAEEPAQAEEAQPATKTDPETAPIVVRGRRRRVVRKLTAAEEAAAEAEQAASETAPELVDDQPVIPVKPPRGRRRAVKKSVQLPKREPVEKGVEKQKEQDTPAAATRGRRRAVRKTAPKK